MYRDVNRYINQNKYYMRDGLHGEIEVYNKRGYHMLQNYTAKNDVNFCVVEEKMRRAVLDRIANVTMLQKFRYNNIKLYRVTR